MNAVRKGAEGEAEVVAVDPGVAAEVEADPFSLDQAGPEGTDLAMAHHFGTGCLVLIKTLQASLTLPIRPVRPILHLKIIILRMTTGKLLDLQLPARLHGEDGFLEALLLS